MNNFECCIVIRMVCFRSNHTSFKNMKIKTLSTDFRRNTYIKVYIYIYVYEISSFLHPLTTLGYSNHSPNDITRYIRSNHSIMFLSFFDTHIRNQPYKDLHIVFQTNLQTRGNSLDALMSSCILRPSETALKLDG